MAACAECVGFRVEEMMGGYHAYKDVWDVTVGELLCQSEHGNAQDTFTVAAFKDEAIVGHAQ